MPNIIVVLQSLGQCLDILSEHQMDAFAKNAVNSVLVFY